MKPTLPWLSHENLDWVESESAQSFPPSFNLFNGLHPAPDRLFAGRFIFA